MLKITIVNKFQDEFIANIKYYRKQQGLSQEKLAELCNVATSTIGCIESAHQNPSFENIIAIATALSVHPADLFLRDSSKAQNRELYSKYHQLMNNCEHLPDYQQQSVCQLAQSLADAHPDYNGSKK